MSDPTGTPPIPSTPSALIGTPSVTAGVYGRLSQTERNKLDKALDCLAENWSTSADEALDADLRPHGNAKNWGVSFCLGMEKFSATYPHKELGQAVLRRAMQERQAVAGATGETLTKRTRKAMLEDIDAAIQYVENGETPSACTPDFEVDKVLANFNEEYRVSPPKRADKKRRTRHSRTQDEANAHGQVHNDNANGFEGIENIITLDNDIVVNANERISDETPTPPLELSSDEPAFDAAVPTLTLGRSKKRGSEDDTYSPRGPKKKRRAARKAVRKSGEGGRAPVTPPQQLPITPPEVASPAVQEQNIDIDGGPVSNIPRVEADMPSIINTPQQVNGAVALTSLHVEPTIDEYPDSSVIEGQKLFATPVSGKNIRLKIARGRLAKLVHDVTLSELHIRQALSEYTAKIEDGTDKEITEAGRNHEAALVKAAKLKREFGTIRAEIARLMEAE